MLPHQQRRTRLIQSFPDTIDAFLVSRGVNVRYLTGFTGSNASLLLGRDGSALLATDGRYVLQVAAQAPDLECLESRDVAGILVEHARERRVGRLGIEAADVTLALHETLRAAAGEMELVAVGSAVEALRAVKDATELAALRRACEITDASFEQVIPRLSVGVRERDVAWWLQSAMRDGGAEAPAFDSIVAFGPHSAIPHHEPTDRALAAGDLVKLDFGARYDGYHADMTRTVVMSPVAGWQRDLHALVVDIQRRCSAETKVGAVPAQLDAFARDAVESTGHQVAHGLGHGVGLEIHEAPFLTAASSAAPLVENVAVTIEPGIYLPGRGGVRIEDTVVVGRAGVESLTASPRDLIEIG